LSRYRRLNIVFDHELNLFAAHIWIAMIPIISRRLVAQAQAQGIYRVQLLIPLTTQHYPMLQRNLVYTGMTQESGLSCWSGSGRRWQLPSREHGRGGAGRNCGSGLSSIPAISAPRSPIGA
jgi:hypothetical protein